jgi:trehalose synthase
MEVQVPSLSLERLRDLIDPDDWSRLIAAVDAARSMLAGRELWNINSTATGGGVAEMLRSWVGLATGLGVGMRWLAISGSPDFFSVTKRLHNFLHGEPGDGGGLGEAERKVYEEICRSNAEATLPRLGPHDVIFLHDPQTAGLVAHLRQAGRPVIWRCHVGADEANEYTRAAWDFLEPHVTQADACVFSRAAYVPAFCEDMLTAIVPPSIDATSPKNQDMEPATVQAILRRAGLLAEGHRGDAQPEYALPDGTTARVERRSELLSTGELPGVESTMIAQISRWDSLKDPVGVLRGFAMVAPDVDAHLVLAGPSLHSVADDPDGRAVFDEVEREWRGLPPSLRSRVHLALLPMQDPEENAAIVNALQRQAGIIVQKSLKEGFGLTVTEAMWKARPVVASAIGGIRDQIDSGVNGVLLPDPLDLEGFGAALLGLIEEPGRAQRIGLAARETVRSGFLENRHTLQYVDLLRTMLT